MLASAPRRAAESPPEAPASYRLLRRIGSGGMAEVFLAVRSGGARGDDGLAVIKRIWPELAHDPDFIAMFLDEAGLCARMAHPNVVRTYEVGRDGDQLYIAMEYLRGRSLRQVAGRLGPRGLPLPLQLKVLADVLAGLDHAHELSDERGAPLGIVHRDVSPQNVFVTYDGAVKLVDFGIAKSAAASHCTRPGVMKGRLAYMAPEQMRAAASVDRRADLFSVGVMLWEAAAGRRLWHDLSEAAIVGRLLSGPAIAPPLGPGRLPTGLLRVCRRAVALDPAGRYATAAEFRRDLLELIQEPEAELTRTLARAVSSAFAEERATLDEVARRGMAEEQSAPGLSDEAPPPTTALTESALRPIETAPTPPPRPRPVMRLRSLALLAVMAAGVGFASIHFSSSSPGVMSPGRSSASDAPRAPAMSIPPTPIADRSPVAPAREPALSLVDEAVEPAPSIPAPPAEPAAPLRAHGPRHRHSRPVRPVAASTSTPVELTAAPAPRPRSIDVDNPYQP